MSAGTLVVKIAANITDFSRGLDAAEKRLMRAGENLERMGQNLTLKVTAPLLATGALFAKSAAEDAASVEKMGRAFGKASGDMESFVQQLMKSVPATDDALRGLVTSTDTLLTQMGLAPSKATAMTKTVTRLAGDFAAFGHVSQEIAQDALEKALLGKTKGLAQFGVAVSEADIKAKAYQMGLAKTGAELTHTATAQAALAVVLERSQKIQGEAARTINDDANAVARLKQAADGVADSFGRAVLPTFVKLADGATKAANALASLPEGMQGLIVGGAAIAAAIGPVIYVGGNLVKTFTLARSVVLGLGAAETVGGLFTLAKGVRTLGDAAALARLAVGGLWSTMLVPAAVLGPIAAIAYLWWKSGEASRNAAAEVDRFRESLDRVTDAKLLAGTTTRVQQEFDAITAQVGAARAKLAKLPPAKIDMGFAAGKGGSPAQAASAAAANALRDQIRDLEAQQAAAAQKLYATGQKFTALMAPDAKTISSGPPGFDPASMKPYQALEENANRLGSIYELTNAKGRPLAGLNTQITSTIDALNAALTKQADKWGDVALRIRQAVESLQRYGEATLLPGNGILSSLTRAQVNAKLTNIGAVTPPGAGAPMANITQANVDQQYVHTNQGDVRLLDYQGKQLSMQERMAASLVNLPQEFANSIGTFLGPVLARMGGGVGAGIGGALGGAVGKGLATGVITDAAGKVAGGVIGSVVPIVGTIVGSLVGAKIGGFIDGLFGKKNNDAADAAAQRLQALADAARKVQEAIAGLPQGIKLATYRFEASAGSDTGPGTSSPPGYSTPAGSSSRAPASTGPVFSGDIHIYGVQDIVALYRQLSEHAEAVAGRGGVTGLQLAVGG